MQATLAPPEELLGPLPHVMGGAAITEPALLLFYAEDDEHVRLPDEDLDEILALRCASL